MLTVPEPSNLAIFSEKSFFETGQRSAPLRSKFLVKIELLFTSCSSSQRVAHSFLRIPSRPGQPCRSANTCPCGVCRGLSAPSDCALRSAPKKTPASRACGKRSGRRSTGAALGLSLDQLSDSTLKAKGLPPAHGPAVVLRQPTAAIVTISPAFSVSVAPAAVGSTGEVMPVGTTARV